MTRQAIEWSVVRRRAFPYAMAAPATIAVGLVLGLPILFNIYLGSTNTSAFTGLDNRTWIGLDNYVSLIETRTYRDAFFRTLIWTATNLALQMALGMLFALVLHATTLRVAKVMQSVWLIPWFLPSVSMFFVWKMLYDPSFGGIDALLGDLAPADGILGSPRLALWGIILAGAWKGFPLYMAVFYAGLQAVPQELYDAARVDGASRVRVFRHIELPELRNIAVLLGIIGFVWTFNWFTPIFIMTSGGPGDATLTLPVYVYERAITQFYLGVGAAAANALLLLMTAGFVTIFLIQRYQRKHAESPTDEVIG